MKALARRVRKLESSVTDASGLVPHSEAWFEFWEDKFDRFMDGEAVDMRGFTLAVTDRIIERADHEEQARIQ